MKELQKFTVTLVVLIMISLLSFEHAYWWLPILGLVPLLLGVLFNETGFTNLTLVWACTSYLYVHRNVQFGLFELLSVLFVLTLLFLIWRIFELWDLSSTMLDSRNFSIRYLKQLTLAIILAFGVTLLGLITAIQGVTDLPFGSTVYTVITMILTIVLISLIRLLANMHKTRLGTLQ